MEGVVAARRLRKSMLNSDYNTNVNFGDLGITNVKIRDRKNKEENKYLKKFKIKIAIKSLITVILLIVCVLANLLFKEKVKENNLTSKIINIYKLDISKEEFLENFEDVTYNIYSNINYIFPRKLVEFIQEGYIGKVKPYLSSFSFYNFINKDNKNEVMIYIEDEVDIYDENSDLVEEKSSVYEEENVENKNGVGGGIEEENASSSISSSDEKVEKIKKLEISISWPTQGTITSLYGVRDKIFEDIGDFHSGLDIANSLGTEVKSATNGKVIKVEYNNRYYGNTLEIEEKGVVFKYAHLSEILVSEGKQVSEGELIAKMGSTGYSTGPHLHFEVRYEGTTVDPQKLLPC